MNKQHYNFTRADLAHLVMGDYPSESDDESVSELILYIGYTTLMFLYLTDYEPLAATNDGESLSVVFDDDIKLKKAVKKHELKPIRYLHDTYMPKIKVHGNYIIIRPEKQ